MSLPEIFGLTWWEIAITIGTVMAVAYVAVMYVDQTLDARKDDDD